MNELAVHPMAGLPIARMSPGEAVAYVSRAASLSPDGLAVHFITAHTVSVAEGDPSLREVLTSGDLLLPDSRWLELLSGIRKRKLSQVRGPDFFRLMLTHEDNHSAGHFFVTPNQEVTDQLQKTLHDDFPGVAVLGFYIAPHRPLTDKEIIELSETINAVGQPIVWLGVGTPAQNFLAHTLSRASGRVVIGVGAAFEFLSGVKSEAPRWMSRLGVEWLYRLITEPKRLWRRYLIGNAVFLWAVLKGKIRPQL